MPLTISPSMNGLSCAAIASRCGPSGSASECTGETVGRVADEPPHAAHVSATTKSRRGMLYPSAMRLACTVLALAIPVAAVAGPAPVVGGSDAPIGKWRDVAAVYDGSSGTDQQVCSGTLIAPTIAITAGHCNEGGLVLDNILVGTNSLANPDAGETLPIAQGIEYPSSQTSEDVTVLVLGRASRFAPRAIATGWARLDIANGAKVSLVGYRAVDKEANTPIDALQEADAT